MTTCMAKKVAYTPDKLKMLRESQGLSHQDLAEKIGVTKLTVIKYEKNRIVPTEKSLMLLGEALNVLFYADWQNKREYPKKDTP